MGRNWEEGLGIVKDLCFITVYVCVSFCVCVCHNSVTSTRGTDFHRMCSRVCKSVDVCVFILTGCVRGCVRVWMCVC